MFPRNGDEESEYAEKINTRIAPLHAELDRCPVRLVEVEDELGSLSVDDLVASARDQESRLALGRVPWLPFSVQFLIPISRAREGTTGIEVTGSGAGLCLGWGIGQETIKKQPVRSGRSTTA
ncbi:hypothetical protein RIF29_48451 [Crotalaria pallida]|uniref:Uncharacterized protein n=1 Tax=Crotalaria pallida TaxID=3830 RepID=A0AAN9DRQ3_CROPI